MVIDDLLDRERMRVERQEQHRRGIGGIDGRKIEERLEAILVDSAANSQDELFFVEFGRNGIGRSVKVAFKRNGGGASVSCAEGGFKGGKRFGMTELSAAFESRLD